MIEGFAGLISLVSTSLTDVPVNVTAKSKSPLVWWLQKWPETQPRRAYSSQNAMPSGNAWTGWHAYVTRPSYEAVFASFSSVFAVFPSRAVILGHSANHKVGKNIIQTSFFTIDKW